MAAALFFLLHCDLHHHHHSSLCSRLFGDSGGGLRELLPPFLALARACGMIKE